ncbi:hypothetical protein BH24ACI4_BH24ACI4_04730 [soil metagenome]
MIASAVTLTTTALSDPADDNRRGDERTEERQRTTRHERRGGWVTVTNPFATPYALLRTLLGDNERDQIQEADM